MDDLSALINGVLSDPESMKNLQQAAAALGLGDMMNTPPPQAALPQPSRQQQSEPLNWSMGGGGGNNTRPGRRKQSPPPSPGQQTELGEIKNMLAELLENTRQPTSPPPPETENPLADFDFSALSGLLDGLGGGGENSPAPPSGSSGGGLDLSALSGLLGGLAGTSSGGQGGGGMPDISALSGLLSGAGGSGESPPAKADGVSALTAMLGGNQAGGSGGSPLGGLNMNMLLKFQQAMSGMSANAGNVKLMMAVKGQLKDPARIAKVDDAVKVMQVVQFFPILKESGLFGKLDEMLTGLGISTTGSGGGLAGILSSLGGSGGPLSLLSGLTGRR